MQVRGVAQDRRGNVRVGDERNTSDDLLEDEGLVNVAHDCDAMGEGINEGQSLMTDRTVETDGKGDELVGLDRLTVLGDLGRTALNG